MLAFGVVAVSVQAAVSPASAVPAINATILVFFISSPAIKVVSPGLKTYTQIRTHGTLQTARHAFISKTAFKQRDLFQVTRILTACQQNTQAQKVDAGCQKLESEN
jgi:hypothetical protein